MRLFYSHWGASHVPADVFWGPSYAEAFISCNEPATQWLDDVWAEGGVGLDKDDGRIAFFGGQSIDDDELVKGMFLGMMRGLWSDWSVSWVEHIGEVADAVGVNGSALLHPLNLRAATQESLAQGVDEQCGSFLVTVLRNGEPDDRVGALTTASLLAMGPPLIDAVLTLPRLADLGLDRAEDEPLLIDVDTRTVHAIHCYDLKPRGLNALRARWPGWRIEVHHERGYGGHFARSGRTLPPGLEDVAPYSREELLARVTAELFGERGDPVAAAREVVAGKSDMETHPSLFVSPPDGRPDEKTRALLFRIALEATTVA